MGSFKGHILPGSMFIGIGLLWCFKSSYRFFRRDQKKLRKPLYKQFDFWESAVIIFLAIFGLVIEQMLPWEPKFQVTDKSNKFTTPNNWQHSTMYAFFTIAAIAKIFVMKFPNLTPHCAQHFLYSLAFAVEGYLFYFHTHGREELDVRLHVLLVYAAWGTAMVFIILAFIDNANHGGGSDGKACCSSNDATLKAAGEDEGNAEYMALNPFSETPAINFHSIDGDSAPLSRRNPKRQSAIHSLEILTGIFSICHGCWFWQIAYVLYPPNAKDKWDQEDHRNIGFATMFFTWYLIASIVLAAIIHFGVAIFTFRGIRRGFNIH